MPIAMPTALRRAPALYPTGTSPSRPPLEAELVLPHPARWRFVKALASLWPLLRALLDMAIVGGAVGGLALWVAATVGFALPNLHAMPLLRSMLAHPILVILAALPLLALAVASWRASVVWRTAAAGGLAHPQYLLRPVGRIPPATFVPRFVAGAYATRHDAEGVDADDQARMALRAAAAGDHGAPLGICVYGRAGQGKTRLAWEAALAVVPRWTLLRWPHEASEPFDLSRVRGRRIVLWLDDLQDYARPGQASLLRDLPRLLHRACRGVVVVATCRDGADEERARATLADLMTQLRAIRPTDLPNPQMERLAVALERIRRVHLYRDDVDGTPGSLLLGSASSREAAERELRPDAWRALRALRLLRAAGIQTYAESRVRATAEDVFDLGAEPGVWPGARDALVAAGILRVAGREGGRSRCLEPVGQVYLEGADLGEGAPEWRRLRTSLAERRDAHGLLTLGNAYRERTDGDPRANSRLAESCYRGALAIYSPRIAPEAWAAAQNNLAIMLVERARGAAAPDRAAPLVAAVTAYQAAARAYRQRRSWGDYARVRAALGLALRDQARLAATPDRRLALLGAAAVDFRAAERVRALAVDPAVHALAHAGLEAVRRERHRASGLANPAWETATPTPATPTPATPTPATAPVIANDDAAYAGDRGSAWRSLPLAGLGPAETVDVARDRSAGTAARLWRSALATAAPLAHGAATSVATAARAGLAEGMRQSRRLTARAVRLTRGQRAAPVGMLTWAERASAAHARPVGTSTRLEHPLADMAAIAVAIDAPALAADRAAPPATDVDTARLTPVLTEADPETGPESDAERALRLDEAIAAYRAALDDTSHTLDPMVRARTRLDLAETLVGRAELIDGTACVAMLREAVAQCAAANAVFAARSASDWERFAADLILAIRAALDDAERAVAPPPVSPWPVSTTAAVADGALAPGVAMPSAMADALDTTRTEHVIPVLDAPVEDQVPLALVPASDGNIADGKVPTALDAWPDGEVAAEADAEADAERGAAPPDATAAAAFDANDVVWEVYEVYEDDVDGDDLLTAQPRR